MSLTTKIQNSCNFQQWGFMVWHLSTCTISAIFHMLAAQSTNCFISFIAIPELMKTPLHEHTTITFYTHCNMYSFSYFPQNIGRIWHLFIKQYFYFWQMWMTIVYWHLWSGKTPSTHSVFHVPLHHGTRALFSNLGWR